MIQTIWFGQQRAPFLGARDPIVPAAVAGMAQLSLDFMWPDVDIASGGDTSTVIVGRYRSRAAVVHDARAVALSPLTDWDQCVVVLDGVRYMLAPGVLIRRAFTTIDVEPLVVPPATRLVTASSIEDTAGIGGRPPSTPYRFEIGLPDGGGALFNVSGAPVTIEQWNGTAWVALGVWASGAAYDMGGGNMLAAGTVWPAPNRPPADVRIAGLDANFADYLATGLITLPGGRTWIEYAGGGAVLGRSSYALDSHGNAGGGGVGYMTPYRAPLSPLWYGKLGIDVWVGESPCSDFRPVLAPERVIYFGGSAIAPAFTVPAGADDVPSYPLVTVPAGNVRHAQFTFEVDQYFSTANLVAAIGSPLVPREPLDQPATVQTEIATAALGGTATRQAVWLRDNVHNYLQVILGRAGAPGAAALNSATLVLRRENIGR